jgi:predicted aspartyl protease
VGIFSVGFTIRHKNGTQLHALNGVVDTGSSFVIIPEHILDEMGVERDEQALFRLADGSVREMFLGETLLDLQDRTKTVQVVFGPDPRKVLLGAMALEAFGLAADAKNHRLKWIWMVAPDSSMSCLAPTPAKHSWARWR